MNTPINDRLTLGPVMFSWAARSLRDFYFRIADEADIDTVYLGEVICSKRFPFLKRHLPEIIERLQQGGKKLVFSSLALVGTVEEVSEMEDMVRTAKGTIEANDVSLVRLLQGKDHHLGPFVNVYNEGALDFLIRLGAKKICLNPELPASVIKELAARSSVPLEVIAFGRFPISISARCFDARAKGRSKDDCRFACLNHVDGLTIQTLDKQPFLTVNGMQTLTYGCGNLLHAMPDLQQAGIHDFRLSPQSGDMVATASLFRQRLKGEIDGDTASALLAELHPEMPGFSNGFLYSKPGHQFITDGPVLNPMPL
ncbi:MAG: U32 family peptidase [Zymomonas mobilis subsp. pomaceae]|uniref:Ubiquinone biosynthesis protein UbiV n=1 Tax=Zymomonas mobilis subsp. pomaceae (strain ATCC 29192 / DSM 22645 / JCM 10191 / CCUG 17912 / NBRC 13757 / NCIMB 11200 / NRRL B-4491 / Barker I) TaxID=579138 RepID=F8ETZ4_ZYMMT|nr:U32 family peptidase [Zymomonas mobilis]AEI38091.1 peptidase U32 [Zymomonas mobilis subsp. pomaceae ATCC 29192]MDX5949457.1 U32 family peptidase [Zymomonas mobilis subsp. pomaceae]GEB89200.1 U32 family peptidase [Zymomonas mobilis subsp. pomaceae]